MSHLFQISRIGHLIKKKVNYKSPKDGETKYFGVTANKHHIVCFQLKTFGNNSGCTALQV